MYKRLNNWIQIHVLTSVAKNVVTNMFRGTLYLVGITYHGSAPESSRVLQWAIGPNETSGLKTILSELIAVALMQHIKTLEIYRLLLHTKLKCT